MVALEILSNYSSLLDVFLVTVTVAVTGFAIKEKFLKAAEKKSQQLEDKIFNEKDPYSLNNRVNSNHNSIIELRKKVVDLELEQAKHFGHGD